jgi:D-alanine-D-alanine ligase
VALPHSTFRELGAGAVLDLIVARLGLPLMVKPASGGSALGVQKVSRVEDLPAAMVSCFAYGDTVHGGALVDGVELALSVVDLGEGPRRCRRWRSRPESGVFDYTARYTPASPSTTRRPGSRTTVAARAAELAVRVHEVARPGRPLPHRRDRHPGRRGALPRGERLPGLTETSMFPMAVEAAGSSLGDVLARLLTRRAAPPLRTRTVAGSRGTRGRRPEARFRP